MTKELEALKEEVDYGPVFLFPGQVARSLGYSKDGATTYEGMQIDVRDLIDRAHALGVAEGRKEEQADFSEKLTEAIKDTQTMEDLTARLFMIITQSLQPLAKLEESKK